MSDDRRLFFTATAMRYGRWSTNGSLYESRSLTSEQDRPTATVRVDHRVGAVGLLLGWHDDGETLRTFGEVFAPWALDEAPGTAQRDAERVWRLAERDVEVPVSVGLVEVVRGLDRRGRRPVMSARLVELSLILSGKQAMPGAWVESWFEVPDWARQEVSA